MWRRAHRFDREKVSGEDRYYHLVLLAENNKGYENLMKLVSRGFVDGFYYKPRVDYEVLEDVPRGNYRPERLPGRGGAAVPGPWHV